MRIGIDLDATITAYPEVFSRFTKAYKNAGHEIHIITDRPSDTENEIVEMLKELRIEYDFIKITQDKVSYILKQGIEVLYDDTDEYFLDLPEKVAVFKVREHYNFDFIEKKWRYSDRTGRKI